MEACETAQQEVARITSTQQDWEGLKREAGHAIQKLEEEVEDKERVLSLSTTIKVLRCCDIR